MIFKRPFQDNWMNLCLIGDLKLYQEQIFCQNVDWLGSFCASFTPPKLNIPFKISQNCIHYTVWEIIHYTPKIPFYQLGGGRILFSMGDYSLCVLFIPGVLTVLVLLPRVGQDLVVLSMTCNGWPLHPCMSLPLVSAYRGVSRSSVGLPICIDGSHLSWCRNSSRFFR